LIVARDAHLRFVEMHNRALHRLTQKSILGTPVVFSESLNEAHCRLWRELFGKKIRSGIGDQPVRHPQCYSLINDPGLEIPSEELAAMAARAGRGVPFVTDVAVAHGSGVPNNGLAAARPGEYQIEDRMLRRPAGWAQLVCWVDWAHPEWSKILVTQSR
jgi:hypothetical protein